MIKKTVSIESKYIVINELQALLTHALDGGSYGDEQVVVAAGNTKDTHKLSICWEVDED